MIMLLLIKSHLKKNPKVIFKILWWDLLLQQYPITVSCSKAQLGQVVSRAQELQQFREVAGLWHKSGLSCNSGKEIFLLQQCQSSLKVNCFWCHYHGIWFCTRLSLTCGQQWLGCFPHPFERDKGKSCMTVSIFWALINLIIHYICWRYKWSYSCHLLILIAACAASPYHLFPLSSKSEAQELVLPQGLPPDKSALNTAVAQCNQEHRGNSAIQLVRSNKYCVSQENHSDWWKVRDLEG